MAKVRTGKKKVEEVKPEDVEPEEVKTEEVKVKEVRSEEPGPARSVIENRTHLDVGGGLTWLVCIALAIALIHFSCGGGTATGYVGEICTRGLNIWDYAGLICCSPLYLLYIIIASGGLKLW